MELTQKNVTVPTQAWAKLRRNAQATGVPLCIYLTYLIEVSEPVEVDDLKGHEELQRIEEQRGCIPVMG